MFIPARASFFKTTALLLEGPNVQIIFVLHILEQVSYLQGEEDVVLNLLFGFLSIINSPYGEWDAYAFLCIPLVDAFDKFVLNKELVDVFLYP
jgi:hypothetical protein